jgi:hypothetical protein
MLEPTQHALGSGKVPISPTKYEIRIHCQTKVINQNRISVLSVLLQNSVIRSSRCQLERSGPFHPPIKCEFRNVNFVTGSVRRNFISHGFVAGHVFLQKVGGGNLTQKLTPSKVTPASRISSETIPQNGHFCSGTCRYRDIGWKCSPDALFQ